MAPNEVVETETTVDGITVDVMGVMPARGEVDVIQHVDEMAYVQDVNPDDITLVESDTKLVIEDAPMPNFEFNYNMNEDMFSSIWNMTLNKNDDTFKRILASKQV